MVSMQKSTHTQEYQAALNEIRELRRAAGLTQRALASLLDVSPSWVAKVESGERRLDLLEFYRLCLSCGRDPAGVSKRLFKVFRSGQAGRRV